jgi:hypothetical protein
MPNLRPVPAPRGGRAVACLARLELVVEIRKRARAVGRRQREPQNQAREPRRRRSHFRPSGAKRNPSIIRVSISAECFKAASPLGVNLQ